MSLIESNKLLIVWTSGDKDVAKNMVFMYALNSKLEGWWDDVTLLVWGPSSNLLAKDADLQEYLKQLQEVQVRVVACKRCAMNYEIEQDLLDLGLEVFFSGQFLTDWIRSGDHYITF
jgi:hypothetical protein